MTDELFAARTALANIVTRRLGPTTSLFSSADDEERHSTVGPQLIATRDGFNLAYAPPSLHGVVWMQVAMAAAGQKRYPRCKFCRRPFEVSKGQTGKRVDREFCTDVCKSADYRKRRALVSALAKKGISLDVILKRARTPKETVKKWLSTGGR